ncbi:FAD-binding protein [Streptomyces diacarni]|uniref:3-oxosteroid 1-dehydrogenase n=1 Tax=Streptomyces diacarni TaxID=2800381 RepID=A0A367F596_9ACTN|nr:FAD-binding protein [Streptomyces diacarni]RCG24847.1 FAD-binding protein [Streptomyces diacarni]
MAREWDEEYDVVVVGSAGGALTCAYLSAHAGLSTAVVEKTSRVGGMAAYSGAALWLPGTQVQRREGVDDSTDAARTYLRALLGEDNAEKREAFLAEAPALVRRLEDDPALAFRHQVFPDYYERPGRVPGGRSVIPADLDPGELGDLLHLVRPPVDRDRAGQGNDTAVPLAGGRALIARLLLAYHRTGNGTVRTHTRMEELVTEGDRVTGIVATGRDGRRLRVRGRRGVLLAGGGFEHNDALRRDHGVPGDAAWSMAPAGTNTGEPLTAALALGAATDLLDEAWLCPGLVMPDGQPAFVCGLTGGLVVDAHGARYANESLPYDRFGRQMAADPARIPSHVVFDDRTGGRFPGVALPPPGEAAPHLAAGTLARADTLQELADLIRVPAKALTATVERFNAFADSGADEDFGRERDEYGHWFGEPVLQPVRKPPYYAARLILSDLGTKGGLVTDAAGRVRRADGTAIAGLYAAGNTSASFTGSRYPGPGMPIGTSMVFGALAAKDLIGREPHRLSAVG